MKTKKALGWLLAVSLGALAAPSLVGCGGVVTKGGGDGGAGGDEDGSGGPGGGITDPGSGGSGGWGGGGCDPGCPPPEAVAMTYAQLEAAQNGGGSGSGTTVTTGGGPDPSTQFLMFGGGTETPTCTAPYGNGQCGGWSARISIAPALFQVGIIPFSEEGLDISVSESTDEGNGQCSGGGGGGFEEGQLEILAITPTTVHFVVSGVTAFFDDDPNGERIAARCP